MKDYFRKMMKERIGEQFTLDGPSGLSETDMEIFIPKDINTVFAFMSTKKEIDSRPLIRYALEQNKKVALPRVQGKDLFFHQITEMGQPLSVGAYGIPEPTSESPQLFPSEKSTAEIEFPLLVIVPGLAFTTEGERLGKGGGYYDRFLTALFNAFPGERNRIIVAGAAWTFQMHKKLPYEKHDVKVNCVYTEKGCIVCTNALL